MNIATTNEFGRRTVSWIGTQYSITVTREDSAGLLGVFESVVPAGEGPPLHVHHNEDEVIHVIEGEYEFWLDGQSMRRGPGHSVFLPRGVPHTFRIVSQVPGRNLGIVTPGGFENFFVEMASRGLEIPTDLPEIGRIGADYGLEFKGPAPWKD